MIAAPGIIRAFAVHDVFSAIIAEQCEVPLLFLGGFGVSASHLGLPDLNFISAQEMSDAIRRTTARVKIPVIADGDTGHGGLPHVRRTVELFEQAGAAGILLEDQVFPKRCGHFENKECISAEEMGRKIKAAVAARSNPNFVIIARTDSRAMHGLDEAIKRVGLYGDQGADIAFVEAPQSKPELEEIASRIRMPLFANMLVGGKTPILSAEELEQLGYKIAVCPIETLLVCADALKSLFVEFMEKGKVDEFLEGKTTFNQLKRILGLRDFVPES